MNIRELNEKLFNKSICHLFPDGNFEDKFKQGEIRDEYFIRYEYKIRMASPDDLDSLVKIEDSCWAIPLQTSRSEIEQRLLDPSCFTFVLEYEGEVVGVNYAHRIHQKDIKKINSRTLGEYRDLTGRSIQLIALNILPAYQDRGWGHELKEFVLQYFSLHSEIDNVYAITRCRDFNKSNCSTMHDYFKKIYRNGQLDDPILNFHQLHGAKVLGLIENYRPSDTENHGYGVLVYYDINNRPWSRKNSFKVSSVIQKHTGSQLLDLLKEKLNTSTLDEQRNLKELGLDSMDCVEVLLFMQDKLGIDISMRDLNHKNLYELIQLCEGGHIVNLRGSEQQPLKKRIRNLIRQYPEIVPLSLEGEGPCTFWIHPLSGDVGIYNMIANQFDGAFRMIAIKARGFLTSESKPFTTVKEMAKYYSEIITAVEPEGPYHLAGFSFGGTIAYEIARQLQIQGKEVKTLLFVESPFISGKESELFKTTYRNNLLMNANFLLLTLLNMGENLLQKLPSGEIDWDFYKLTSDDVKDVQDQELIKYIVRFCKGKGMKQTEEELEFKLLSMSNVHISNLKAIQDHHIETLPRPNTIKTWLFRTESAHAVSDNIWNPDYLENIQREQGSMQPLLQGWNSVLPQLETIILEGDNHFDILHSDKSTKKFYQYCKDIYTNQIHGSQSSISSKADENKDSFTPAIAIVGMSGKFPDAENVEEFWENLKSGHNSIREFPADRGWNMDEIFDPKPKTPGKTYSKWGGFLSNIDKFDPMFFKIPPREAELMDPSERIFLEEAWKAIEDAGYSSESINGKSWGVFACAKGDYSMTIQNQEETYYLPTDSYAATRLSYLLNLVGPAITIDTACSSTLSVVVEACNSLALGNCEAAIVGGGSVYTTPNILIGSSQSLLLSPDGQCYTFDERANGTVVSEAIGVVVLKLLDQAIEDKDHIYGVIRGWGMNQDGKTNGMTAPSGLAQSRLHTSIYEKFNINPENITMIEAHGTGTQLGDAIEYNALSDTFRKYTTKEGYCALGSLKTNIGHAFFGSGIAGIIKILLSIKNSEISPILNYEKSSSKLGVESSPFFINTTLKKWETKPNQPRCAAINSFGATGTNAHLVIEEYISNEKEDNKIDTFEQSPVLFLLSAKDENRLEEYVNSFLTVIEKEKYTDNDLRDIAYTLQVGREIMPSRLAMTVTSIKELKRKLNRYLREKENAEDLYSNLTISKKKNSPQEIQNAIEQWMEFKQSDKLLKLWVKGSVIDWESLYRNNKPKRISLPTYPFAKERYWIQTKAKVPKKENKKIFTQTSSSLTEDKKVIKNIHSEEPYELMMFTEEWEKEPLQGYQVNELKTIVCFVSNPLNQKLISAQLKHQNQKVNIIFISQGKYFEKLNKSKYFISTEDKRTYQEAFRTILEDYKEITAVLYLWPYEDQECIENYQNIIYIIQAMMSEKVNAKKLILSGQYKNDFERCYMDSWIGFERSLGPMMFKTRVKVVIQESKQDKPSEINEDIIERIWKETEAINKDQSVLYAEGNRYEYKLSETSGNSTGGATVSPIKTGGTYLITGGLGKLGIIFARYLAQQYSANLLLTGRSKLSREKQKLIEELENLGSHTIYIEADICDKNKMREGIEVARERFGEIHGIIHAAGLVEKQSIFEKDIDNFEKVINPKIKGTLVFEELLQGSPIDFICYFSSAAAILGDFGSCDYAVGNRFQMAYTRFKNKLEEQKKVLGKTIVVNWPVWRDGGMGLDREEDSEIYLKSSGQRYLETEEGLKIFEEILTKSKTQHFVIAGQKGKVNQFLKLKDKQNSKPIQTDLIHLSNGKNRPKKMQGLVVEQFLERDIKKLISELHNIPMEKLDSKVQLVEYGFDSINLFDFARMITNSFDIEITPSTILSYSTIEKLINHMMIEYKEKIENYYKEKMEENAEQTSSLHLEIQTEELRNEKTQTEKQTISKSQDSLLEPIAIIGMSGRFPQSDTIGEFWNNLKDRKECITEVPKERWDWQAYDGTSPNKIGKSNSKWGGFLTNIDQFDPLFFKISPKEAHIMDPCQRLFLEESWHALEDAGYMGEMINGKSCGVYVGIEEGDYGNMARQEGHFYSNQNAVLSARIAYALDLKGPNLSITASCSSGLVALHQACQSLRNNDCEMALVGGINLFVSPNVHVGMSELDLLSPTGKSYVFDDRADGLVPSEAVAVVLLKPLSKAIRDKDQIYGCIKGSGVNNNGKGHGIMAPNPLRQAELINETLDKYHIDPVNIQYIISHSVGTKLGDAAEIEGLKNAIRKYTTENQCCSIGSIKPLIGHTFAASGIVSLITMLMAMKNKTKLGLHNYENSNENINFSKTPFIASKNDQPWTRKRNLPRMGAISTSGNSGTNAFAVIEEYTEPKEEKNVLVNQSQIFIFSAADKERLQAVVKQMIKYIECNDKISMSDISYTLQVGREVMPCRLAIIAKSKEELIQEMRNYLSPILENTSTRIFTGNTEENNLSLSSMKYEKTMLQDFIKKNDLKMIASYWTKGGIIKWESLYPEENGRRISLPTYPFKKERYWMTEKSGLSIEKKALNIKEVSSIQEMITEYILNFFSEELDIPKEAIKWNKYIQDYGVDSILTMKFIRDFENHFQFRISGRDIIKYPTFNSLSTYLTEKLETDDICINLYNKENKLEISPKIKGEYKDVQVIEAIEQYIDGIITIEDLEKSVGVNQS